MDISTYSLLLIYACLLFKPRPSLPTLSICLLVTGMSIYNIMYIYLYTCLYFKPSLHSYSTKLFFQSVYALSGVHTYQVC